MNGLKNQHHSDTCITAQKQWKWIPWFRKWHGTRGHPFPLILITKVTSPLSALQCTCTQVYSMKSRSLLYKHEDIQWYLLKLWLKMLSGKVCDWIKLMLEVKDTLSINSPPSPLPDLPCNIISSSSANHTITHSSWSKEDGDLHQEWGVGGGGGGGTNQRAGGPGKITFDSAPGDVTKSWGAGVFPWLLHV